MTKQSTARPTCAALVLRPTADGKTLMAYHRSVKAGLHEFTTVGGEINAGESDLDAIRRELIEEYRYPSCDALQIIDLRYQATHERRGELKNYRWFLVIDHHRGDATKVDPDSAEVVEIRWDDLEDFQYFSSCFSAEKRSMLEYVIDLVKTKYPNVMQRRRVA